MTPSTASIEYDPIHKNLCISMVMLLIDTMERYLGTESRLGKVIML